VTSEIILLFLRLDLNKKTLLQSPKKRLCCGIKGLGHIGEKGFQELHCKGMVEGMDNFSLNFYFYEHCLYGMHNRARFSSRATREEGILQLVHNDVFGSVLVPSLGKSVYYVSFID
jgi:hypothetical protein